MGDWREKPKDQRLNKEIVGGNFKANSFAISSCQLVLESSVVSSC